MNDIRTNIEPPRELEDRVVAALRARGLLAPVRKSSGQIAAMAAAALLCLAIGFAAGQWRTNTQAAPPGPEFMLVLHYTPEFDANPTTAGERVDAYRRWAQQVAADGHPIRGQKLKDAPGDSLAGFFIVSAPSREVAEAIAATCPHARLGGRIDVREIDPT